MKTCISCKEEKEVSEFPPNKAKKDGLNVKCRSCYNEYQRQWYKKNPELHKQRVLRSRNPQKERAFKYGLSLDEMEKILSEPCRICKNPSTHIDHCHKTNKVRGGLCHACNVGLGFFRDDVGLLQSAIEYLRS